MSEITPLSGRIALITGGAGGIGTAIAQRFARAGAWIVIADLHIDVAQKAAQGLTKAGHRAVGLGGDVSRSADADTLAQRALEAFGRIDILVNNAGIMGRAAPLQELKDEDWNSVIGVDLSSVFYVTRAVIPHMRARARAVASSASPQLPARKAHPT